VLVTREARTPGCRDASHERPETRGSPR